MLKNDVILSIVIASYNRNYLFERALKSLDNRSVHIDVVKIVGVEGLAKARNLGWKKAKGKYVAYIDDDAVADSDWTKNILAFIDTHPGKAAFGGPYYALNENELPSWIPEEVHSKILPIKTARPIILPNEWLNGTNMVFRRDILEKLGGFNEKLGVNGNKRAYGEETDLQIRIHNAGYEIWYDPSILVFHEMAKNKQNMLYLLRDQCIHGMGSRYTFEHLVKPDRAYVASSIWTRVTKPGIPLKTRIYFLAAPAAYGIGMCLARIKASTQV